MSLASVGIRPNVSSPNLHCTLISRRTIARRRLRRCTPHPLPMPAPVTFLSLLPWHGPNLSFVTLPKIQSPRQPCQPHSHLTVRQISHELEIPKSCVIKQDLKLKYLGRKRAQELTEVNKVARYERSNQFLRKYRQHAVDFVWFSDEKLFTIAAPRNAQNDRIYVHSAVKKRDVAGPRLLRTRPTFSQSIMVTVPAVSTLGYTAIHFFGTRWPGSKNGCPGVKINGEYYRK